MQDANFGCGRVSGVSRYLHSLSNNLHQHSLAPPSIELPVKDLLPGAEV